MENIKNTIAKFPSKPGIYFFYDAYGRVIYVGKAAVLKNRLRSYFTPLRQGYAGRVGVHDNKTELLVSQIYDIKYKTTDSVIEALILEANEIKRLKPKYNVRDKDDKSFVQIILTDEDYPRFIIKRPTQDKKIDYKIKKVFGPYTNPNAAKEILKIFRRVFKYRDCSSNKFRRYQSRNQPCLFYPLNLCPAPCVGDISKYDYQKIIKNITEFLQGKKKRVLSSLKQQMQEFSRAKNYEIAAKIRDQIEFFTHINDVALIKQDRPLEQLKSIPRRIEAYDISNLSGKFATGSMVVFTDGVVDKDEYRRFKIKSINNPNDVKMLEEVISRRLKHGEWEKPDLILLDGGVGQLSKTNNLIRKNKLKIPVIALAKGPTRKGFQLFRNKYAKSIILDKRLLVQIRDEAHRFAINYHRKLRSKSQFST